MAAGAPTRDFITGNGFTACAQLQVPDEVAVLIMSRKLKDTLEKKAFDAHTDSLQTAVDVNLSMEMRLLAAYEEKRCGPDCRANSGAGKRSLRAIAPMPLLR